MYKFYSLIQWLYPSICELHEFQVSQLGFDKFLVINRNLLRSNRDEGFLLAIKCINEDVVCYSMAAKESDIIKSSLLMLNKQIIGCKLALADQNVKNLPRDFSLLSPHDKAILRAKLNKMIDICLPTILWTAFCDLNAYKELCNLQVHEKIAELLYLYALTFLPDQHNVIASSGLLYFIQLINPSQVIQDIYCERVPRIPYAKTIEARRKFSVSTEATSMLQGAK